MLQCTNLQHEANEGHDTKPVGALSEARTRPQGACISRSTGYSFMFKHGLQKPGRVGERPFCGDLRTKYRFRKNKRL